MRRDYAELAGRGSRAATVARPEYGPACLSQASGSRSARLTRQAVEHLGLTSRAIPVLPASGCRASTPACRARCPRSGAAPARAAYDGEAWVIIPSYSGRGSHSGSASGPIHGSTPCSVRNSWPPRQLRRRADALGRRGQHVAGRPRPTPSKSPGVRLLRAAHDPRGQVAGVDHLHLVLRVGRRQRLAALGQPLRPVREAAGRVVGADDQPGPDHRRRQRPSRLLAGDLHRAVRLGVLPRSLSSYRLAQRDVGPGSGVSLSAYTLTVETKTQCASGNAATALRTRDGIRDVDDGVVLSAISSVRRRGPTRRPRAFGHPPDRPRVAQVTSCPRRRLPPRPPWTGTPNRRAPGSACRYPTPSPKLRGKRFRSERTSGWWFRGSGLAALTPQPPKHSVVEV